MLSPRGRFGQLAMQHKRDLVFRHRLLRSYYGAVVGQGHRV